MHNAHIILKRVLSFMTTLIYILLLLSLFFIIIEKLNLQSIPTYS